MGSHLERHPKPLIPGWLGRGKREFERFRALLKGHAIDERGQSTVEYAVVMAALLCILTALGMLGDAIGSGLFAEHAIASASHHLQGSPGGIVDALCY